MAENEESDNGSSNGGAQSGRTTPAATGTTTTSTAKTGGSSNGNNKFKGKGSHDKYSSNSFGSNDKDWEGAKPDFGAVLGLKTERLQKKVTFEIFREKAKTFVFK